MMIWVRVQELMEQVLYRKFRHIMHKSQHSGCHRVRIWRSRQAVD